MRHATEFLLNNTAAAAKTMKEWAVMAPGTITMLNGAAYEMRKNGHFPHIGASESSLWRLGRFERVSTLKNYWGSECLRIYMYICIERLQCCSCMNPELCPYYYQ